MKEKKIARNPRDGKFSISRKEKKEDEAKDVFRFG